MYIYRSDTIRAAVRISRFLQDRDIPTRGNRTMATWRGGDDYTVSFDDEKGVWDDHKTNEGGSVIDLCMKLDGVTALAAIRTLGDAYHVTPEAKMRKPRKRTRAEMLIESGYELKNTYTYTDADGKPIYYVERYEKPEAALKPGEKRKEFIQRTDRAENLDGIRKLLYNLPAVIAAQSVVIVEGEKDADTLNALGYAATTNSGGGAFWNPAFNATFAGKDVIIIPDNDPTGEKHAVNLYSQLRVIAATCRIARVSKLPKGDVTDYMTKEGGTPEGLRSLLDAATEPMNAEDAAVAEARTLNDTPLTNYTGSRKEPNPRRLDDIVDEVRRRFLDFPRRIGSQLFDYTRDEPRRLLYLENKAALRAWINGTSSHQSDFATGPRVASWDELFERLLQRVRIYNGIARSPWFPERTDVFPTFPPLADADSDHPHFKNLMARFCPATEADRRLIAAFFMAPMFYSRSGPKPAFIVDTVDAQGSGKSTVVKCAVHLYGEDPIGISLSELDKEATELAKRFISSDGRGKRFAFIDNVVKLVSSGPLAALVTQTNISGRAAYGRGEESRPNDITWCLTVNGAEVDTDMATRAYTIKVRKPDKPDPLWEQKFRAYCDENRWAIFAEMLDMMRRAPSRVRKSSRFAEFDATVLSAACDTDAEFDELDALITSRASEENGDREMMREFIDLIATTLARYDEAATGIRTGVPLVIRMSDIDGILRRSDGALRTWKAKRVKKLAASVGAPEIHRDFRQLPHVPRFEGYRQTAMLIDFTGRFDSRDGKMDFIFVTFDGGIPKAVLDDSMELKA